MERLAYLPALLLREHEVVDHARPHVTIVMIGACELLGHLIDDVEVRFPFPDWFDAVRTAVDEVTPTIAAAAGADRVWSRLLPEKELQTRGCGPFRSRLVR